MPDNNQILGEILGLLIEGRDVPEPYLRWAKDQSQFGFDWVPTQKELKTKLIQLGHLSD